MQDWIIVILLTMAISLGSYRLAAFVGQVRWGVRSAFLALIGGLTAYSYLAIGLPGSKHLLDTTGAWGILLVTLVGCAFGVIAAWSWRRIRIGSKPEN
jgi:uncharacterized membrane protein YwaF